MSIGWFSIGREDGAPAWYGGENQPPLAVDLTIAALLSAFITPTLAFLLILPGIRRLRAISSFTFLFSMTVGATIMVSLHYPGWHTGEVRIHTPFKAFTSERLNALLGVKVGLRHVNVTYSSRIQHDAIASLSVQQILTKTNSALPINGELLTLLAPELDYNERFDFHEVNSMDLDTILQKGLPYPILKVIEYLSTERTGFLWGKQYRSAGYYTHSMLWFAFACWLLQMLLLCAVPHCFAPTMLTVGMATLLGDLIYAVNVPQQMVIRFPGPNQGLSILQLSFSTCFYATVMAGTASMVFGLLLWLFQKKTNYVFETFLSAYLDDMSKRKLGKEPPEIPDQPSSTSILLMKHRHRTIQAIAKQLNPGVNCISLPSTPMTFVGSSLVGSSSLQSSSTQRISPVSGETELLSNAPTRKKPSSSSLFLEDGLHFSADDLCLSSSSCGVSLKSMEDSPNTSWFSPEVINPWADEDKPQRKPSAKSANRVDSSTMENG